MFRRLAQRALLIVAATLVCSLSPAAAASAAPWWKVVTGSHPTNLWAPQSQVQEIVAPSTPFALSVDGVTVGAFNFPPFFPDATAANVQASLEIAYGAGNVQVTGGPGGVAPLNVTWIGGKAGQAVPPVEGPAVTTKILQSGGSGRLVISAINMGNTAVEGTTSPVVITDQIPEGMIATDVEGIGGARGIAGPVDCTLVSSSEVTCSFEGTLPSYEAIEIEVSVSMVDDPPSSDAPGEITITGGGADVVNAAQEVSVSPEEVPFGVERFSAESEEEGGQLTTQAGGHPFQFATTIQLNSGALTPGATRRDSRVEQPAVPRNFRFPLPEGLVGNAAAMPQCKMEDFLTFLPNTRNECKPEAAIGVVSASLVEPAALGFLRLAAPVFNLAPGAGEPARFGFAIGKNPVVIGTVVDSDDHYRITGSVSNTTQLAQFLSSTVVLWGAPGDTRHDSARGWNCAYKLESMGPCERPDGLEEAAFLRQPVACVSPLIFDAELEPWNEPIGRVVAHDSHASANMEGCASIPFEPTVVASLSSNQAESSSGLAFRLDMPNAGLLPKDQVSEGQAKRVEVTLPDGVTVNPSQAEGLGACSPADYARETASSAPGQGCPEASKIGSIDVTTPLLEEEAKGSVYIASPYDNPFDSLIALYVVAKIPERGVLVKQAGKVELDPKTGQLVSTFDDLPQIPFETFNLNFFEGSRAPLVMPPKCGTYDLVAKFTPWHASNPDNPLPSEVISKTSSFTVNEGPNGGPCPSGTPPFKPGFTAGTTNNAAGDYSPFTARLTRNDGEQEFSRFSVKLPKGVIGKLAGVQFCSEAAIAAARARTGPNGGQEELENPSCPAASEIGRTLVGAGVGPALTYAPGKIYLAGPFQGSKLSIVAITTAKVGPFDLGTVVIRQALKVNSETAEVSTDGAASDPIPRILQGVVVRARDIRVFVDRENFVLNPTSCDRMTAGATVVGSGLDLGSLADDQAVDVSAPFQAADCANLGFKPSLSLQLLGSTKRTGNPRLKAVLKARPGDANIGRAQVTLPSSAFLEQAHIRTVCTRVQFRAGAGNGEQCPKASKYGRVKATSPLLDEQLSGPVFLRSSDNELPDLVAALHSSKVDINVVGRIDSLNGRLRSTFETVPDAPVTKFVLEMQGGNKGLIVNSTNICKQEQRAIAAFKGQNGRRQEFKPLVKAQCKGKKGGRRK